MEFWDHIFPRMRARQILVLGFGGLLTLMALAGVDSLAVLRQIRARSGQIRSRYLIRNRSLEQIRSAVYLSGTYTRDYLLDPEEGTLQSHRARLEALQKEAAAALQTYAATLESHESMPFRELETDIAAYWKFLDGVFAWSPGEKAEKRNIFFYELVPRRVSMLQVADKIAGINDRDLTVGEEKLTEVFDQLRLRLAVILGLTLGGGFLFAAIATRMVLRLERALQASYEQSLDAREELKSLSARLVALQEDERRAISRELHDEVGQSLSALLVEVGNIAAATPSESQRFRRHLESIRRLAESSVSVVRNMSLLLRPSMLDDFGLVPAVEWQARETHKRTGLRVHVDADEAADQMPEAYRTCVYRVVQEALHNASRHAHAGHVEIAVRIGSGMIRLSVQDDGVGFDAAQVRGLGLLGMEERVTHLGGRFRIESAPGRGTTLLVELPWSAEPARETENEHHSHPVGR